MRRWVIKLGRFNGLWIAYHVSSQIVQHIKIRFSKEPPFDYGKLVRWYAISAARESVVASGYISKAGIVRFSLRPFGWSDAAKNELLEAVLADFKVHTEKLKKIFRKKALYRIRV